MRVVLCDDDVLLLEVVEAVLTRLGHEVVGAADSTANGVRLIAVGLPDVVIFDPTLNYGSDFDIVAAALAVGAASILFTRETQDLVLDGYEPRPIVVRKPDVVELESALARLGLDPERDVVIDLDRRVRPSRLPAGPTPLGVRDATAFYEALQDLREDDALLSLEVTGAADHPATAAVLSLHRRTDRILTTDAAIRVFLPGAGDPGIDAFCGRLITSRVLPPDTRVRAIVVQAEEDAAGAFDRVKAAAPRALADAVGPSEPSWRGDREGAV